MAGIRVLCKLTEAAPLMQPKQKSVSNILPVLTQTSSLPTPPQTYIVFQHHTFSDVILEDF